MCPLSGNSTLSNKFKVLHDKEKMDNCNGYFEVKEKEENVASGNVAHDFDLGSDKTMVKGLRVLTVRVTIVSHRKWSH